QVAADPLATVGDCGVGVGHLERCHARVDGAENHRRVCRELGGETHPMCNVRDRLRAAADGGTSTTPLDAPIGSAQRQLGVDRVVRVQRRVVEGGAAEVLVVVVVDVEVLVLGAGNLEDLLVRCIRVVRRDPLTQGGG